MELHNQTKFSAAYRFVKDAKGEDWLQLAVKAVYSFSHDVPPALCSVQRPIVSDDEYYGDPSSSALRYSSDFSAQKTASDIALIGSAVAPTEGTTQMEVSIEVGKLTSRLLVSGDRTWKKRLGFYRPSKPAVFNSMPLVYERAFGGACTEECDARNPIGTGFRSSQCKIALDGALLPNIESAIAPIKSKKDNPEPAGVGFIHPTWRQDRPEQRAHPGLIYPGFLAGDESVVLKGFSEEGDFTFRLPGDRPKGLICCNDSEPTSLTMTIEKLFIDTEEQQMVVVWNGWENVSNYLYNLQSCSVSI